MRTKPATRWNAEREHQQYGIYNWFKNHKGISDREIIMECVGQFCLANGFEITKQTKEHSMLNFAGKRFQSFTTFAGKYLIENNYITTP